MMADGRNPRSRVRATRSSGKLEFGLERFVMAVNLDAVENRDWRQFDAAIHLELGDSRPGTSAALSLLIILGLIGTAALAAGGLWMIFSWLLDRVATETGSYIVDFMRQLTGR
jgi:hypothetical protein